MLAQVAVQHGNRHLLTRTGATLRSLHSSIPVSNNNEAENLEALFKLLNSRRVPSKLPENVKRPDYLSLVIQRGRIDLANIIRAELQSKGTVIPENSVYIVAAKQLARDPNKQNDFLKWIQLLPSALHMNDRPSRDLRQFFKSLHGDISVMLDIASVMATKGYRTFVTEDMLPVIKPKATSQQHVFLIQQLETRLEAIDNPPQNPQESSEINNLNNIDSQLNADAGRSGSSFEDPIDLTKSNDGVNELSGPYVEDTLSRNRNIRGFFTASKDSTGSFPGETRRWNSEDLFENPADLESATINTRNEPEAKAAINSMLELDEVREMISAAKADAAKKLPPDQSSESHKRSTPSEVSNETEDSDSVMDHFVNSPRYQDSDDPRILDDLLELEEHRVMQGVEATLPAMLPKTFETGDSAFLDDEDSDYTNAAVIDPSSPDPSHSLLDLIHNERHVEAYSLLQQYNETNTRITPAKDFELPALEVVRNPQTLLSYGAPTDDPDVALQVFSAWFSLIPEAHEVPRRQFRAMRDFFASSVVANIPLMMQFLLIATRKGYGETIGKAVLPTIVRYCPSDQLLDYVKGCRAMNAEYWRHAPVRRSNAWPASESTDRQLVNVAVSNLARAGRIVEALTIFAEFSEGGKKVDKFMSRTLEVLGSSLKARGGDADTYGPYIYMLRDIVSRRETPQPLKSAETLHAYDNHLSHLLSSSKPVYLTSSLTDQIRFLRQSLMNKTRASLPHPFTVIFTMEQCMHHNRSRLLNLLRQRLLRLNPVGANVFVFAEMLFYYKHGLYAFMIHSFMSHFHLVGIPRSAALSYYGGMNFTREWSRSSNMVFIPRQVDLKGRRLYPRSAHIILFWHAFLKVTPGIRKKEILYDSLLQIAEQGRIAGEKFPRHVREKFGPVHKLPDLPPPYEVHRSCFMPFFKPFMFSAGGGKRGAEIILDMIRLGIQPSIYEFTEVAAHYARLGDTANTFMIVDKVEKELERSPDRILSDYTDSNEESTQSRGFDTLDFLERETEDTSLGISAATSEDPFAATGTDQIKVVFPPPDMVFYISIIQGFAISSKPDGVREILRRLNRIHKYKRGEHPSLDKALDSVQAMVSDKTDGHVRREGVLDESIRERRKISSPSDYEREAVPNHSELSENIDSEFITDSLANAPAR